VAKGVGQLLVHVKETIGEAITCAMPPKEGVFESSHTLIFPLVDEEEVVTEYSICDSEVARYS